MIRSFTVYALTDCPFCKKAINLLSEKKLPFLVVIMDKNPEFVTKIKEDMRRETVPIVVEQMGVGSIKIIGGSDDLENYLNSPEFVNGTN
jgi:glutaredoxin-related protein